MKVKLVPFIFLTFLFISLVLSLVPDAQAGLYMQHAMAISSHEEDGETFSFSSLKNIFFAGASFGGVDRFILGQSIIKGSHSYQSGESSSEASYDALEMGPRIIFFFDSNRTISLSLNYNPYLKGERTLASTGESQKISGSSLYGSLSYQVKVSRMFYVGASLNYHSTTISEAITNNVESEVSQGSSSLFPAIEVSARWR